MELLVEPVEVWAAGIPDQPGGLATVLTTLRDAGADLQLIIARRSPERPGEGVVFVTRCKAIMKCAPRRWPASTSRNSSIACA